MSSRPSGGRQRQPPARSPEGGWTPSILMLLAQGEDQTASRRDQVSVLYGREDHSAQRALDAQISRVRRKITEVTGRDAPIVTDYGVGHRFSERLIRIA